MFSVSAGGHAQSYGLCVPSERTEGARAHAARDDSSGVTPSLLGGSSAWALATRSATPPSAAADLHTAPTPPLVPASSFTTQQQHTTSILQVSARGAPPPSTKWAARRRQSSQARSRRGARPGRCRPWTWRRRPPGTSRGSWRTSG
eukprot:4142209-Prymnesium_polylepis.2